MTRSDSPSAACGSADAPCDNGDIDVPDFLPWFPERRSANGWTPDRQRAFLAALARTGSVAQAAAAVGKTARSARQLRDKPGAEHFAVVWDEMARRGLESVLAANYERVMHGQPRAIFKGGILVGFGMDHADRIALGVLEGLRQASLPRDVAEAMRLERWDQALRRREMDLADEPRTRALRSAEEHRIWQQEIAAERRRETAARARKALRESERRARERATGPRVRLLGDW